MPATIYHGAVINPLSLTSYKALPACLLAISPAGHVEWIVEDVQDEKIRDVLAQKGCLDATVVALKHGEFIMPGFIDTHTHAPQVPNIGSGQQHELLDWLDKVTFPMEAKFSDVDFARRVYASVVGRKVDSGTTTCCYYGTLHLEATKALADIIHDRGQRAFVGKCNMDRNSPDYYVEPSPEVSLSATKSLISHIRSLPSTGTIPLVQPIVTPRFAISCTSRLLHSLGTLVSSDASLHIQTHISENISEIAFTRSLFPESDSYAAVYDSFGLLRSNTILAHAVHLEDKEVELIKSRGAGISHCPTSNFNLSSGVAKIGEYLDKGIKVGLGTDVSGGFSPSILTAIQHASIASKITAMRSIGTVSSTTSPSAGQFSNRQFSVATLLYLATLGGADVCDLAHHIGSFAPGKSFDALIVSVRDDAGNPGIWGAEFDMGMSGGERYTDEDGKGDSKEKATAVLEGMLERFFFCGDDRNISKVYVQGKLIGGRAFRQ